jgi:hypothetical protein
MSFILNHFFKTLFTAPTCFDNISLMTSTNDMQLMHLLVVGYLVNLQDARFNNKALTCFGSITIIRQRII